MGFGEFCVKFINGTLYYTSRIYFGKDNFIYVGFRSVNKTRFEENHLSILLTAGTFNLFSVSQLHVVIISL